MKLILALLMFGTAAQAGIVGDTGGAKPEALGQLDGLYVGARLVFPGGDDLAGSVQAGQKVKLEVGIMAGENTAPGDVKLTCEVRFVETDGTSSKPTFQGPCLTTTRDELRSNWTLLPIGMTFRPRAEDPAGVASVLVEFSDDQGNLLILQPSYDWQGGRK